MPRKRHQPSPTGVYHWIIRGIHKKELFHRSSDYEFFKTLLAEYKPIYGIQIYHYCLMRNHAHLLLFCADLESLAKYSQYVQRRYAYYYCGTYGWVGNVFQRGYRSIAVDSDAQLLECGRYIERNPIKAGLVQDPARYPYSSYMFYVGGESDDLLTASPAYLDLGSTDNDRIATYHEFVTQERDQEILKRDVFSPS